MAERGFRDCKECHGEGIVRRHAWAETPELTDLDMSASAQNITAQTEIVPCPECETKRARIKAVEGRMPDMEACADIPSLAHWLNANMVEGARFYISESDWSRLCAPYTSVFAALFGEKPLDRLMSNLIGSGWGAWTIEHDWTNGGMHIERHPTGNKRTYVDADRRHLYREINGELLHIETIADTSHAVADIARMILRSDDLAGETGTGGNADERP